MKRVYPDDILLTKTYRLSAKYEISQVDAFIQMLRSDKRDQAVRLVEEFLKCNTKTANTLK